MDKVVILAADPRTVDSVAAGKRRLIFTKNPPTSGRGKKIVLYSSYPEECFKAEFVFEGVAFPNIDSSFGSTPAEAGLPRLDAGKVSEDTVGRSAIKVGRITRYVPPISLAELRERVPGYMPPKTFSYLWDYELAYKALFDIAGKRVIHSEH